MPRIAQTVALLGIVLALAACGMPPQASGKIVGRVTLQVSGGFTGWDRTLTVDPDGTARVHVTRGPTPPTASGQVDSAVLAKLHSLVADPAFGQLEPAYLPSPGGVDLQDYAVTAEVGGRTIRTMSRDGASAPPILRDVLSLLNGILAEQNAP
jgi:hypothetical protein